MSFPVALIIRINSTWARAAERRGAGPAERNTAASILIRQRGSANQMQGSGTTPFAVGRRKGSNKRIIAKEGTALTAQKDGNLIDAFFTQAQI
jgi:hypothetical protein